MECEAPDIIGHRDAINDYRPRIIRAIAITDVIVLEAHTRLLFKYLTHQQLKAMGASVSNSDPYEIGRKFLSKNYDTKSYKKSF